MICYAVAMQLASYSSNRLHIFDEKFAALTAEQEAVLY